MREKLARAWETLASAWRDRKSLDTPGADGEDRDFLPSALEVLETPPSPLGRWLLWLLCGLFAVAILWSFIGRLDVVAVAEGKTVPTTGSKLVQSFQLGSVRKIYVKNGDHVRAGQLLIDLDPTMAGADAQTSTDVLAQRQFEAARNLAILGYLQGRPARIALPPGTSAQIATAQTDLLRAAIAEYEAARNQIARRRDEAESDRESRSQEVAKLRELLPIEEEQLRGRRELTEKGYFGRLRMLDYEQQYREHKANLGIAIENLSRAGATIASLDAEARKLRESFMRTAAASAVDAQRDSAIATGEAAKAARVSQLLQVRAPIDGVVESLQVTTVGGVVKPADPLLSVVPNGQSLALDARVLNRDIGFVRAGQKARIKFQAFPFTDFGTVDGIVEQVARDAVVDEKLGALFTVRVRLLSNTIALPTGGTQPLGAGLAATAEIRTGSRPIIAYLLSPVANRIAGAGMER